MSDKVLEICCDSIQSALSAQQGGADRIELCENLAQGGVTPSAGKIKLAKQLLSIPVFVLIRPRKADFLYSPKEFQIMLEDIQFAKNLGVDGIVSGVLRADGRLDSERMRQLVEASAPLPFTCHRAFDMCREPITALSELMAIGVKRVLTSGQQPDARLGKENLRKFVLHSAGGIDVLACGNLLPDNMADLFDIEGLREFHSAARCQVTSRMQFRGHTHMGDEVLADEFRWQEVDPALVRGMKALIS